MGWRCALYRGRVPEEAAPEQAWQVDLRADQPKLQ
jgi:hypothetical protein